MSIITITEKALSELEMLLEKEKNAVGVRLLVRGGGCSGFLYEMQYVPSPSPNDTHDKIYKYIGSEKELFVYIDKKSLVFLAGCTLDYEETVMHRGFVWKNPSAKNTCGCGHSFSV